MNARHSSQKPPVVISDVDERRLTTLALAARKHIPDVAQELLAELERAEVVPAARLPGDVVRMGSRVTFLSDDGRETRVMLGFPGEADVHQERISILTPIGTALIGLAEGQSITWLTRDGRQRRLTVVSVGAPAPEKARQAAS
jgi:regulator of nucleoside diphosphate kinase